MATELAQRQFGVTIPAPTSYSSLQSALQPPNLMTERGYQNTAYLGVVEGSEDNVTGWWKSIIMDTLEPPATYDPDSPPWVTNLLYTEPSSFDVEASINSWDIAIVVGILVVGGILAVKVL